MCNCENLFRQYTITQSHLKTIKGFVKKIAIEVERNSSFFDSELCKLRMQKEKLSILNCFDSHLSYALDLFSYYGLELKLLSEALFNSHKNLQDFGNLEKHKFEKLRKKMGDSRLEIKELNNINLLDIELEFNTANAIKFISQELFDLSQLLLMFPRFKSNNETKLQNMLTILDSLNNDVQTGKPALIRKNKSIIELKPNS